MPGDRASILAQNRPARDRENRVQAGVVQRGLPFLQVVHEQVADRLALQPVAVDEFLDGQLSLGLAERADRGRGVGGEDAEGSQPQVEVDFPLAAAGVDPPLGIDQFHAVPDGDIADEAALAGHQRRDPGSRVAGVARGGCRPGLGQFAQPGEPGGVAGLGHDDGQVPVGPGQHPRQSRPDHVCADEHQQPGRQVVIVGGGSQPVVLQPPERQLDPGTARAVLGLRCFPPLLPGVPWEGGQPVQQLGRPAPPSGLGRLHLRQERRQGQPPQHLVLALGRGRPPFLAGPGRELPAQLAVARLRRSRGVGARSCLIAADRVLHDGRHDGRPNSTDSDFGS